MADFAVSPSAVVAANASTTKASGISGAAINAGQPVYADPSASFQIKPAQANSGSSTQVPNLVGIALNSTPGANQPVTYATGGDLTVDAVLTTGQVYVVSAVTSGRWAPYCDLTTGNFVGILGVATSTTNIHLALVPTSTQKP